MARNLGKLLTDAPAYSPTRHLLVPAMPDMMPEQGQRIVKHPHPRTSAVQLARRNGLTLGCGSCFDLVDLRAGQISASEMLAFPDGDDVMIVKGLALSWQGRPIGKIYYEPRGEDYTTALCRDLSRLLDTQPDQRGLCVYQLPFINAHMNGEICAYLYLKSSHQVIGENGIHILPLLKDGRELRHNSVSS